MKMLRVLGLGLGVMLAWAGITQAQTWTSITNQPTFFPDTSVLLTDGTVMTHEYNTPNWWRLTPNNTGSYLNGTWTKLGSMPSNYAPLYFASVILRDGKVIVEGGEYNFLSPVQTNLGAIYDPASNTWTNVNPPSGWTEIGDSPGIVLANSTFMLGQNMSEKTAFFNETNLSWTVSGTGKADDFEEEGFVLLPDTTVLTVDASKAKNAEKYLPPKSQNKWINAGTTPQPLSDPGSLEIGPLILRPEGTVFAMGANASAAGHTAVYTPPTSPLQPGTWAAGPDFPNGNDMADAPAAILPDGNVLCEVSPGIFGSPVAFFEYDGTQFNSVPKPAMVGRENTSYEGRLLVLPTGQIFFVPADGKTKFAAIYTANGSANPSWAPTITSLASTITHGTTVKVSGTQFNGLSNGAGYGDDAGMNTNYPIVRITNIATGHVFYAKTHNFSTMGVATGTKTVSTLFDVPATIETGASTLEVVANGIASQPSNVTVN
ncbi:MAG TPA: hypothetical protein VKB77_17440 [Terriglobales bacterium]|nr:hypothetical protein [Terriglobales bacterium]